MSPNKISAPRLLLTLSALITGVVPFIADYNETHVFNPLWPGHAKFHNGQTMSMGVCLSLMTLWKTWLDDKDQLLTASVIAAMYYVTQASAWFYPGATAFDPPQEFSFNPLPLVVVPDLAIIGLAYLLEQRSVAGRKAKQG